VPLLLVLLLVLLHLLLLLLLLHMLLELQDTQLLNNFIRVGLLRIMELHIGEMIVQIMSNLVRCGAHTHVIHVILVTDHCGNCNCAQFVRGLHRDVLALDSCQLHSVERISKATGFVMLVHPSAIAYLLPQSLRFLLAPFGVGLCGRVCSFVTVFRNFLTVTHRRVHAILPNAIINALPLACSAVTIAAVTLTLTSLPLARLHTVTAITSTAVTITAVAVTIVARFLCCRWGGRRAAPEGFQFESLLLREALELPHHSCQRYILRFALWRHGV